MNWCKDHPKYSAKNAPNSLCGFCWALWFYRCPEEKVFLPGEVRKPTAKKLVKSLVLVVCLLLAGTGEAWEFENCKDGWCTYADITEVWIAIKADDDNIIATCNDKYRNCQVLKPEAFPCYQRMQQAMKAMDMAIEKALETKRLEPWLTLRGSFYDMTIIAISDNDKKQWESTIKDCVR